MVKLGDKIFVFFQQLKMEQIYSSFPSRLFLSTGNKEKTGNEVTFDSRVSDVADDRESETD